MKSDKYVIFANWSFPEKRFDSEWKKRFLFILCLLVTMPTTIHADLQQVDYLFLPLLHMPGMINSSVSNKREAILFLILTAKS